ncbi:MAG: AraC family transcriptional regulator [Capsulimonadaceae bacterium]|nr:AraC family transcriptional regulator [Capsulimonadaceae bacterium]
MNQSPVETSNCDQPEWQGWRKLTPVVRYANFYDAEPSGGFGPRYISDFQILCVQSGAGDAVVDDNLFQIEAGDIVYYGPNERHEVTSSAAAPLRLLGLHFAYLDDDATGINATQRPNTSPIPFTFDSAPPTCPLTPAPPRWLRPRSATALRSRIEALVLSRVSCSTSRPIEQRGLLLEVIEAWRDAILDRLPRKAIHPAVEAACAAIAHDLAANHAVEPLAAAALLSADHFGKLFKQHTGQSLRHYVRAARLIEARRLLVEGRLNVAEVARAVGYEDAFYFSRIFHDSYGVSPSRFRAQFSFS